MSTFEKADIPSSAVMSADDPNSDITDQVSATETRRKVAGIEVAFLLWLVSSRLNRACSSSRVTRTISLAISNGFGANMAPKMLTTRSKL